MSEAMYNEIKRDIARKRRIRKHIRQTIMMIRSAARNIAMIILVVFALITVLGMPEFFGNIISWF